MEFLFQPQRQGLPEGAVAGRRECQIRFQQPLEFSEGLVVKADVRQLFGGDAGSFETKIDRVLGESVVVFFSRFFRVKRSSCAAATISPSTTSAAAESW